MTKTETVSVQGLVLDKGQERSRPLPMCRGDALSLRASAVHRIAEHGVADVQEVNADLVGAAAF